MLPCAWAHVGIMHVRGLEGAAHILHHGPPRADRPDYPRVHALVGAGAARLIAGDTTIKAARLHSAEREAEEGNDPEHCPPFERSSNAALLPVVY